jgi:hypothetical protein
MINFFGVVNEENYNLAVKSPGRVYITARLTPLKYCLGIATTTSNPEVRNMVGVHQSTVLSHLGIGVCVCVCLGGKNM